MVTKMISPTFFLSNLFSSLLHCRPFPFFFFNLTKIVLCFENLFFSLKLPYPFPFCTDKFKERIAHLSSIINHFSFEHVILLFCSNGDQRGSGSPPVLSSSFSVLDLKEIGSSLICCSLRSFSRHVAFRWLGIIILRAVCVCVCMCRNWESWKFGTSCALQCLSQIYTSQRNVFVLKYYLFLFKTSWESFEDPTLKISTP